MLHVKNQGSMGFRKLKTLDCSAQSAANML